MLICRLRVVVPRAGEGERRISVGSRSVTLLYFRHMFKCSVQSCGRSPTSPKDDGGVLTHDNEVFNEDEGVVHDGSIRFHGNNGVSNGDNEDPDGEI